MRVYSFNKIPVANEAYILPEVEQEMDDLLRLVSLGRACRNEANIKNRQVLAKISISCPRKLKAHLESELLDELNIKQIEYLDDASSLLSYRFKPQLRILGRKLGPKINELNKILQELNGVEAYRELKEKGKIVVNLAGEELSLTEEELLIELEQPEGLSCQQYKDYTVALDTQLTKDLIAEGLMREIISKVQTMRKEAGLNISDRIKLSYTSEDELSEVIQQFRETIASEVLASQIARHIPDLTKQDLEDKLDKYTKKWSINGHECTLALSKDKEFNNDN